MVVLAVVGLVGQTDPGLRDVDKVPIGLLGVGVDVIPEEPADATALLRTDESGQLGPVRGSGQIVELAANRRDAHVVDAGLVHETGEQVADLLGVTPRRWIVLRAFGDQVADVLFGAVAEHMERAVDGTVVGDDVLA